MTDSPARGGKRARLVASALDLLYRQGVARTTLADVAEAADVPVGNVYYYFKTKDALVEAVIDAHADGLRAMFTSFERHRDPRARLKAFVRSRAQTGEYAASYGCPHGSLCQELNKRTDGIDRTCATLLALYVDWSARQFRFMGAEDDRELAVTLIAGVEGAALLANTFRDPGVMVRQAHQLERWLDSLP
jgi:TetR/AcrR family transcriptional regulator, transcriptional repressor for nem operon